jgi:hypothetical protein
VIPAGDGKICVNLQERVCPCPVDVPWSVPVDNGITPSPRQSSARDVVLSGAGQSLSFHCVDCTTGQPLLKPECAHFPLLSRHAWWRGTPAPSGACSTGMSCCRTQERSWFDLAVKDFMFDQWLAGDIALCGASLIKEGGNALGAGARSQDGEPCKRGALHHRFRPEVPGNDKRRIARAGPLKKAIDRRKPGIRPCRV